MQEKTWNKFQFTHLLITALIGCIVGYNSFSLNKKVNEAEYSDKAWVALGEYEDAQKLTDERTYKLLEKHFEEHGFYTEHFKKNTDLVLQWKVDTLKNQSRLKNKLNNYEDVVDHPLTAKRQATQQVLNRISPFEKTLGQIEGIIKDRNESAAKSSGLSRAGGYINAGTRKIKKAKKLLINSLAIAHEEFEKKWTSET